MAYDFINKEFFWKGENELFELAQAQTGLYIQKVYSKEKFELWLPVSTGNTILEIKLDDATQQVPAKVGAVKTSLGYHMYVCPNK